MGTFFKNNRKFILILLVVILCLTTVFVVIFKKSKVRYILYPYNNDKISYLMEVLKNQYVDTVNTDQLTDAAVRSILSELDPHSYYLPPKESQASKEEIEGKFYGIGIKFNIHHDTVLVLSTIVGGPSAKAGIVSGDRIITCNNEVIAGKKITNEKAMSLLKGELGTNVKVGVLRRGVKNLLIFDLKRDKINVNSVIAAYMINKNVGYIKIDNFGISTYDEFISAVARLNNSGMKKMIIDLRGNPGGVLGTAVNIVDEFLDKNKLIVYTQGNHHPKEEFFASEGGSCLNTQVVMLLDEFSASASEIFAGAMQDNDRATIIGRRSFGKGLVQKPIPLKDGSELRITIARYYTPSGRCIQKPYTKGVDDYNEDIINRYKHGEFLSKDSIKVKDKKKYFTSSGKVVYGGGGIMPDYFIPLDTSQVTPYYSSLRNTGVFYRFVLDYMDKNRKSLEKQTNPQLLISYLDKNNMLGELTAYATKNNIKLNQKEFNISKPLIDNQLKALIAQNIFDENVFYEIMNKEDKFVKKAMEVLKER